MQVSDPIFTCTATNLEAKMKQCPKKELELQMKHVPVSFSQEI